MTARIDRARRLVRTAQQAEDLAAAELLRANQALQRAEDDYRRALERAAELAATPLSPGFRGYLVGNGARAQAVRAARRDELRSDVVQHRRYWEAARIRTRSMEKLVERAVRRRDQRRAAAERAELADVIAARATAACDSTAASRVTAAGRVTAASQVAADGREGDS